MGDLNRRRGRVLGMNSNHNGKQVIEADIPMSELFGYNTDLRSMTGGLGDYSYEFSRYEQAPGDVQKREIEARAAAKDMANKSKCHSCPGVSLGKHVFSMHVFRNMWQIKYYIKNHFYVANVTENRNVMI